MNISVLGAGRMGSALVLGLLASGHTVTVWNRTASRAAPLAARGARVVTAISDALSADLVIGNLADYAATTSVLAPMRGTFVQLATGTPAEARALAAWAREHRVPYLDGAILATPEFIGQPGCTILYSGERSVFDANVAVLRALGGNAVFVGDDVGHAGVLDAAVLTVLWASLLGTWHAAALCEAEGFPLEALAQTLSVTMPVIEASNASSLARIRTRTFATDATSSATVAICHASVRLIGAISRAHGISPALTDALEQVFAASAHRPDDDVASVFQALRG